jgi:2-oxoglutarate ferredoxin oxidoreductase subunit beta
MDVDVVQALHGRAPSVATGAKRMRPDALVFTLQGDGDMVSEGLQEVIHTAARGESVTAVLLNNGVFGETGGHMTATTVLGQRTKNSLEGRSAAYHGHPILIGDILAQLDGTAYAARTAVYDAAGVTRTKRALKRAFDVQLAGAGFSFVEILTMCPTGWFIPTAEGPELDGSRPVHVRRAQEPAASRRPRAAGAEHTNARAATSDAPGRWRVRARPASPPRRACG